MATVNTLESKYLENEAKMHFTYLRQCSANLNSTLKLNLKKKIAQVHQHNRNFTTFATLKYFVCVNTEQWGCE
jgi:hypothetical protein